MKLFELFGQSAPYELHKIDDGWEGQFDVISPRLGEITYQVRLELSAPVSDQAEQFYDRATDWQKHDSLDDAFADHPSYGVEFAIENPDAVGLDSHFNISGTGNAYLVLSTVMSIIQEVVQKTNPVELWFSASEPSRRKLYDRIVSALIHKTNFVNVSEHSGNYVLVNMSVINKK